MTHSKRNLPAILGGQPAVTLDQIAPNRWPILTEEDEQAVIRIMRDGDISRRIVSSGNWKRIIDTIFNAVCPGALQRNDSSDGGILGD